MNLMDMLSSDGPDQGYTEGNDTILNQPIDTKVAYQEDIVQPANGVYYFPTILTNLQRDVIEICLGLFGPDFIKDIHEKQQRTKIHSLLDDDENGGDADEAISFNEKLDFVFEQIELATNHPSLLVDHFLPKKLLLLEINERLTNMSGKFLLFNKIIDSLLDTFLNGVKFLELSIYNVLVVADSVKELEFIEGLIIGKDLYYHNVSTTKLYDDNRGFPPRFNGTAQKKTVDSEGDYKRNKRRKRFSTPPKKFKQKICLHLITTLQLYNNCSLILSPELPFKLIFSFDQNLDSTCPSIEMIRNQNQNVYDMNPVRIPVVVPVPVFSVNHIQTVVPKPGNPNSFSLNTSDVLNWKAHVLKLLYLNRFNLEDQDKDFFIHNYGYGMRKFIDWFLDWDSVQFPSHEFLGKFTEKLSTHIHEDKLIKKINQTYFTPVFNREFDIDFNLDTFEFRTFKSKCAEILTKRIQQIDASIIDFQQTLPGTKERETTRQLRYDNNEEYIAASYTKLRRLNEDASFVEKKHLKVENDLVRLTQEESEISGKFDKLKELQQVDDIDAKLQEQEKILAELTKEEDTLNQEFDNLDKEHDSIRLQYQESSSEALQLSVKVNKLTELNTKIELKSNGPGIKILPSLIKKDDLINHNQSLLALSQSNAFLHRFFANKLEALIAERKSLLDTTGSSRSNNRISRAATPH